MEWQTLPAEMSLDLRQDGDSEPGRERWHVASSGPPRLAHDHQLIRLAIPSRSNTSEGPPAILAALDRSGFRFYEGVSGVVGLAVKTRPLFGNGGFTMLLMNEHEPGPLFTQSSTRSRKAP